MTTKLKTFILAFVFSCGGVLLAQEHIAESKTLIGMWRQTQFVKNTDGQIVKMKSGNYKVMNPDGTFYAFITWGTGRNNPAADVTTINMYGTYQITSDSTFTEHIVRHSVQPKLNNSESELRFKYVPDSDKNLIYMIWKNTSNDVWVPEMWERVVFPNQKKEMQVNEL